MNKTISGYIKNIFYITKKNLDENEENYEDIDNNIFFAIIEVIDKNNNDHKIKGDFHLKPEIKDEITCVDYSIQKDKLNNDIICSNGFISINLPSNKQDIIDRLEKLQIKGYGKKKLLTLIDKYGENIWNINKLKNDTTINDLFLKNITKYIDEKYSFCDAKSKYILDYI